MSTVLSPTGSPGTAFAGLPCGAPRDLGGMWSRRPSGDMQELALVLSAVVLLVMAGCAAGVAVAAVAAGTVIAGELRAGRAS